MTSEQSLDAFLIFFSISTPDNSSYFILHDSKFLEQTKILLDINCFFGISSVSCNMGLFAAVYCGGKLKSQPFGCLVLLHVPVFIVFLPV